MSTIPSCLQHPGAHLPLPHPHFALTGKGFYGIVHSKATRGLSLDFATLS